MREFNLTTQFPGYNRKIDESKLLSGVLVNGSKNVHSIDGFKIASRPGFTLVGDANTAIFATQSSYDWTTSSDAERNVKSYDDELEVLYNGAWVRVANGFTATNFEFTEWWNDTEKEDEILFCNGTSDLFIWNGAITTIDSAGVNTLTKTGTTTWGEERFYTSANKKIMIGGVEYTYTAGEGTTTLTGVTPNPNGVIVGGEVAIQSIVTSADLVSADFNIDVVSVLDNSLWVGSKNLRDLYVSKTNDYTDFAFSANRLPGEGALITIDACPRGFISQDEFMYISAGESLWYQSKFALSADNTKESLTVKRLKSAPGQGALSQSSIGKIKNDTVFISFEPSLDFLGNIENISTEQATVMSDAIKLDFDSYDFSTNSHIKYWKNNLYVAIPNESKLLIFNLAQNYWEAPWDLPAGRLAIIDGDLCVHSNATPETYKLYDGYNDNGNPIESIAKFAYNNFGIRTQTKNHTEWYTEGFITPNTILNLKIDYDYKGFETNKDKDISGSSEDIILASLSKASLGKENLGKQKIGGTAETEDINKFRVINELDSTDYYEIQPTYSSNDIDQRWELLAFGADSKVTSYDNNSIKQ